jgi:hypothetical protein
MGLPVSRNLEGMKYLGFSLKPNNYSKRDWQWLCLKLKKDCTPGKIDGYPACRLVLVKSVLEAIPVYWTSLAWVPKGILEKISQLSFVSYGLVQMKKDL